MIYPEIKLAQAIIKICKAKNIQQIIISPGSRNAPLTIGFASDPFFKCYSIADERCAAFFGMGIAQQTQRPTALICTSGSALLNYYPAVAEAFYSQIPLIVISADRPLSKIDIGDGQTIRQQNVYENHILYSANLTEEESPANDALINNAINTAIAKKGPVHINAPFEEPLYNTVPDSTVNPSVIQIESLSQDNIDYTDYIQKWNITSKKLVLVGVNDPNILSQDIIDFLGNDTSVVVMTETMSNLHHKNFAAHIDRIITTFDENDFKDFQPEILITLGGMVVSKRIKAFLRKYKPAQHWHIDTLRHYNTYDALSDKIFDTPQNFFTVLKENAASPLSDYQPRMLAIVKKRKEKHAAFIKSIPFSDLKVFDRILPQLPPYTQLQIGNSSAVRYTQLIPIDETITVFCNRGTSGIDGSTSTAIGAAIGSQKTTVLITGDVSFFYDSNALWNNYIPSNFKIILINNNGGGIFRILPGHQENQIFNTYFETSHQYNAQHLAKMYGFEYLYADNEQDLEASLSKLWKINNSPSILEIKTPSVTNDTVLSNYFKNL